jgi:hypothetical protein
VSIRYSDLSIDYRNKRFFGFIFHFCFCVITVIWQLRRRGYLGKTVIVNMQGDGTQRLELAELIGLPYVYPMDAATCTDCGANVIPWDHNVSFAGIATYAKTTPAIPRRPNMFNANAAGAVNRVCPLFIART